MIYDKINIRYSGIDGRRKVVTIKLNKTTIEYGKQYGFDKIRFSLFNGIQGFQLKGHDERVLFRKSKYTSCYVSVNYWYEWVPSTDEPQLAPAPKVEPKAAPPAKETPKPEIKRPTDEDIKALDRLIDAALEDFVITDDERKVLRDKANGIGFKKVEFELYLNGKIQKRMKEKPEENIEDKIKGFFARLFG